MPRATWQAGQDGGGAGPSTAGPSGAGVGLSGAGPSGAGPSGAGAGPSGAELSGLAPAGGFSFALLEQDMQSALMAKMRFRSRFEEYGAKLGQTCIEYLAGGHRGQSGESLVTSYYCSMLGLAEEADSVPEYRGLAATLRSLAGMLAPEVGDSRGLGAGPAMHFLAAKVRDAAPWVDPADMRAKATLKRELHEYMGGEYKKLQQGAVESELDRGSMGFQAKRQMFEAPQRDHRDRRDRDHAPGGAQGLHCAKCHGGHHIKFCTVEVAITEDGSENRGWDYGFGPGIHPPDGPARGGGRQGRGGGRGGGGRHGGQAEPAMRELGAPPVP